MKSVKRSSAGVACLCTLALVPAVSLAQTSANLRDVVITASRTEQRADEALSDITVIRREQLDLYSGQTLLDVLSREAGLQVSRNGGPGSLSSVFIRGANSNQTLLLVDGARLGDAFFSRPLLEEIPLESIERIEVLRGPASSLYGSDAIGGVLQIVTRQDKRTWSRFTLGSDKHASVAFGTGGTSGPVRYSFNGSRTTERTFSATRPGTFSFAADDDPYRLASYNARIDWQITNAWSVRIGQVRSVGRTHIDQGDATDATGAFSGTVDTRLRTRTDNAQFLINGKLSENWSTRIQFAQSRYKAALEQTPPGFGFPPFDNQNDSDQQQVSWQNDWRTAFGLMTVGVENLRQTIESRNSNYVVRLREGEAIFAGINGSAGLHHWQLQARSDSYDEFGRQNTGLMAYGYQVLPSIRLKASGATSFRVPALIDQYFPFGSNPDLKPEEGRNIEVGADFSWGAHTSRISIFRHRVDGLIALDNNFVPQNIPMASLDGVSVSDSWKSGNWRVTGRLDFVDPVDRQTGQQLSRRAKEQGSVTVDYHRERWSAGLRGVLVGERFNDAANTAALAGYGLLDMYASRKLCDEWTVTFRVDNVLDKQYETVQFFRQPERRVFVTLAWQQR